MNTTFTDTQPTADALLYSSKDAIAYEGRRYVRECSDYNRSQVIPKIAETGNFTLDDFFTLHRTYFRDMARGASNDAPTRDTPTTLQETFEGRIRTIRDINVSQGDVFAHPDAADLPEMTQRFFEQINTFFHDQALHASLDELHLFVLKCYLGFSILHIPVDGSGRTTEDATLAIQSVLHHIRPDYTIRHISEDGSRKGDNVSKMQDVEYMARLDLMTKIGAQLQLPIHLDTINMANPLAAVFQFQRKLMAAIKDDPALLIRYHSLCKDLIDAYIDGLTSFDPASQPKLFAQCIAQEHDIFATLPTQYYETAKAGDPSEILDRIEMRLRWGDLGVDSIDDTSEYGQLPLMEAMLQVLAATRKREIPPLHAHAQRMLDDFNDRYGTNALLRMAYNATEWQMQVLAYKLPDVAADIGKLRELVNTKVRIGIRRHTDLKRFFDYFINKVPRQHLKDLNPSDTLPYAFGQEAGYNVDEVEGILNHSGSYDRLIALLQIMQRFSTGKGTLTLPENMLLMKRAMHAPLSPHNI